MFMRSKYLIRADSKYLKNMILFTCWKASMSPHAISTLISTAYFIWAYWFEIALGIKIGIPIVSFMGIPIF